MDSGGAWGARAPPEFGGSEKGQSLISAYRSLAITTKAKNSKCRFSKPILYSAYLSIVLLLISNLTNGLCLHQFLVTKSAEVNKFVKTDAKGAEMR